MSNTYLKRKLGPLAYIVFNSTNDYGVNRVSDDVILVDSSYNEESYLFYSSQKNFEKVESEIRKTRKIENPSKLIYREYQRSFTFNNPSYNKVKGYAEDRNSTGIIKAGHIIDFSNSDSLTYQAQAFIEMILLEASIRLSRVVSKSHLIEVIDKIEYVNQEGFSNAMKRFLGIGGVKEKVHSSMEIDKSRIALQTIINNSIDKVKRSFIPEDREELKLYSGVVVFRLLLTDTEKDLDVIYSK